MNSSNAPDTGRSDSPQNSEQPLTGYSEEPEQAKQPAQAKPSQQRQRVPSGISGLDTILNGGFLQGGTYFISGDPGTGKTILSNQMAFSHVASGGHVVYVSLLSETHSSLFSHLSSLSFFDLEPVGTTLYYISGYSAAQKEGLRGLLTVLQGAVRDNRASLLIVDGMLAPQAFKPSDLDFKEFIQQLQLYAEAYGCTVLLLSSVDKGETSADYAAGQTSVDGLIHMSNKPAGLRPVRQLHVQKLRGSNFMEGVHAMEITGDGVQVYPRLELVVAGRIKAQTTRSFKANRERASSGVEGLDDMLGGGLFRGSSTVLLGPTGCGKTLLGLTFLAEGSRQGEHGLYFGLNEPPALLLDAGDQIGLGFSGLVERAMIQVLWQPALEGSLDVLAHNLLTAVKENSVKRLFIDGLDALDDINIHSERIPLFFTALMEELRNMGVTTVSAIALNSIIGPAVDTPVEGISARVGTIIFLRTVELRSELRRIISVLKNQRSGHDNAIREFKITDQGLEVGDTLDGAEATLTGVARTLRDNTA